TRQFKYILNLKPGDLYKTHIDAGNGPDGRVYWDSWVKAATTDSAAADLIARYQHRPAEELYDLAADSTEQHNLAGDAGHAQALPCRRRRRRHRHARPCVRTRDLVALRQLRLPRHRHRRRGDRAQLEFFWQEAQLRVERLLPAHFLAAARAHPSHDRR